MEDIQNKIKEFDKARNWDSHWNIKDLCLNMNEEIGELWHLIKWIDEEKQKEIINKNKKEAEDFIGDMMFILLKMANQMDVNVKKEIEKVLEEYEKRMPSEKIKEVGHANKLAGGWDNKE